MSKSIFSIAVVSGLIVCSTLAAAVSTGSLSNASATQVVTMPTVTVVGKRDTTPEIVMLPTVTIVAHRDSAIQVASR